MSTMTRHEALALLSQAAQGKLDPDALSQDELVMFAKLIAADLKALTDRVAAVAEVPCPRTNTAPMRCFPRDLCSFCRCRALIEAMR